MAVEGGRKQETGGEAQPQQPRIKKAPLAQPRKLDEAAQKRIKAMVDQATSKLFAGFGGTAEFKKLARKNRTQSDKSKQEAGKIANVKFKFEGPKAGGGTSEKAANEAIATLTGGKSQQELAKSFPKSGEAPPGQAKTEAPDDTRPPTALQKEQGMPEHYAKFNKTKMETGPVANASQFKFEGPKAGGGTSEKAANEAIATLTGGKSQQELAKSFPKSGEAPPGQAKTEAPPENTGRTAFQKEQDAENRIADVKFQFKGPKAGGGTTEKPGV